MLSSIVGVLRISLERDLCGAKCAVDTVSTLYAALESLYTPFDVEAEDLNPIVILPLYRLFARIELASFVDELTA